VSESCWRENSQRLFGRYRGAAAALGETGKGMVNYLMVLGIVETVALFVLVFSMMLVS
jgi:F0F1-type ATP synthase membrane subunit c/vacuolar-type H+-ATPase subunit K